MSISGSTRSLVLNGASLGAGSSGDVAAFLGRERVAYRRLEGLSATASLALICQEMLRALGWQDGPERLVAVTGPGSFTGLRASLALADGLAFGCGATLHGVTTGQCFRSNPEWVEAVCVTQARRNRIFAEHRDGTFWAGSPETFVLPERALVIGNGVEMLHHQNVRKIRVMQPDLSLIFEAGLNVAPSDSLQPLYVDAPEAKVPAQGLRPFPV